MKTAPTGSRRITAFITVSVVGLLIALALDLPVLRALAGVTIPENDAYRMFRVMGYLPVWWLVALGLWLAQPAGKRAWRGSALLAVMPVLTGLVGEVLKFVFRRVRPEVGVHGYQYIPWEELRWSTNGLGLPSSHAIVAFGAAWVLCRLFPRGWPVWFVLATGCAVTRIVSRAHYVSDCFVAAVVSYSVVWLLWQRMNHQPE
jgi:membrane-associated phospholipid phosphatase